MNPYGWGPPGGPGFHHQIPVFAPLLGALIWLLVPLLIAAVVFFLIRRGKIGPPPWITGGHGGPGRVNPFSPEYEARRTLANRFANGEISPEEFLERAAALNWTPGVDHRPENGKKS